MFYHIFKKRLILDTWNLIQLQNVEQPYNEEFNLKLSHG